MEKIIHRIYFGFDGKPDPYLRYLKTWEEELPDFKVMHWNANNLPLDNCAFSSYAASQKDFAFLSDYFRWWLLKEYGGVYFDADIEVTNGSLFSTIFTEVNNNNAVYGAIGIDNKQGGWYTAHSMVMKPDSPMPNFMCNLYEGFGDLVLWRRKVFYFMAPQLSALYFHKFGHNPDGMGSTPNLSESTTIAGIMVLPQEYFSPLTPCSGNTFVIDAATEKTCVCHHFSCSWHDDDSSFKKNSQDNQMLLSELISLGRFQKKSSIQKAFNKIFNFMKR